MREGEADEGFVWKRWRPPGGEGGSRPSERIEEVAWIGLIIRMGPNRVDNGNCLKKHRAQRSWAVSHGYARRVKSSNIEIIVID
jgi:hypothetical protein